MSVTKICLLLVCCAAVCGCKNRKATTVSMESLLLEMTDHHAHTRFNEPAYRSMQSSSWDRSQKSSADRETWFANKDYDNAIRIETKDNRQEYVIMEAKGPGAVTRWWIPQESLLRHRTLRIYIDDNPEPVIEENYESFMNGSARLRWPFAFTSSDEKDVVFQYSLPVGFPKQVGADFYLPLPFSKSCKITLDDRPFYYIIDYRLYPEGTRVIPLTKATVAANDASIRATAGQLSNEVKAGGQSVRKEARLKKGESIVIPLPAGAHAIESIRLKIDSENKKQVNRSAVLQISFDGHQTVWSPVAEFFGGGVHAGAVKNYKMQVTKDGLMMCNWSMPYRKEASLVLKNYGDEAITAGLEVSVKSYEWASNSMYFHAGWHEEAPLNAPPKIDWNYIEIKGKGRYVGDVLTAYSIPKGWWGEGDEKIYIDGDTFPSQLGTGLEDYYGYAWGMANYFNSPFISMPSRDARGKGDWRGYNTMARMRLLDDVVFNSSLKLDVEAWLLEQGVSFAVCCFWYGIPGSLDNIKADEVGVTRRLPDFQPDTLQKAPGEAFPDIPTNRQLVRNTNGPVQYVGNHLDLLDWRNKAVSKPLDGDHDDVLGTEGYQIIAGKVIKNQQLLKDSIRMLPAYIQSFEPRHTTAGDQSAYLPFPDSLSELHLTGLIEVKGEDAPKGILSFIFDGNTNASCRVGIMLDNAGSFDRVGKYLWLTTNKKASSPRVSLVRSNRIPDWYFFDLTGLKKGDTITVHGATEKTTDVFTIGAVSFDGIR